MKGGNVNKMKLPKKPTISQEEYEEEVVGEVVGEGIYEGITILMEELGCSEDDALAIFNNDFFKEQVQKKSKQNVEDGFECAFFFSYLREVQRRPLITTAKMIRREEIMQDREAQKMYKNDDSEWKKGNEEEITEMMKAFGFGLSAPNNQKLYDKAKKIADEKYSKPSAYKSGFIVKSYKDMGGTYSGKKSKTLPKAIKKVQLIGGFVMCR